MSGARYDAVDLCAGAGGWEVAAAVVGLRVLGVEIDDAACATRAAAGLATLQADVATLDPRKVARGVKGVIASPPCPVFSMAGLGAGRAVIDELIAAVQDAWRGADKEAMATHREVIYAGIRAHLEQKNRAKAKPKRRTPAELDAKAYEQTDSSMLMCEPGRWVRELNPVWVACEQVPPARRVFEHLAACLRRAGYATWVGVVNAADYGVPQTRQRSILMAHRDTHVFGPVQTHADPKKGRSLFLAPWVTMAQAIGYGLTDEPSGTVVSVSPNGGPRSGALDGGAGSRKRYQRAQAAGRWQLRMGNQENAAVRDLDEPAPTIAFGHNASSMRWQLRNGNQKNAAVRDMDEPAPTVHFGRRLNGGVEFLVNTGRDWKEGGDRSDAQLVGSDQPAPTVTRQTPNQWHMERPATTVAGDPRIAQPGHKKDAAYPDAPRRMEGAIRITIPQAAVLQDFPPDWPWQGSNTQIYQQIGNAVPGGLAFAILRELV